MSELERQKEHSRYAYLIDPVSFTFPLTHNRLLQHYIICMGFELDSTALVEEGTEFLQNTNHIAHCQLAESECTKVLQNTNHIAHCHIAESEGTKVFQNTNHIAHHHIAESETTKVLQNTNHIAQSHRRE
jgi:hypothetical protein